jgi:hypothetical protein
VMLFIWAPSARQTEFRRCLSLAETENGQPRGAARNDLPRLLGIPRSEKLWNSKNPADKSQVAQYIATTNWFCAGFQAH